MGNATWQELQDKIEAEGTLWLDDGAVYEIDDELDLSPVVGGSPLQYVNVFCPGRATVRQLTAGKSAFTTINGMRQSITGVRAEGNGGTAFDMRRPNLNGGTLSIDRCEFEGFAKCVHSEATDHTNNSLLLQITRSHLWAPTAVESHADKTVIERCWWQPMGGGGTPTTPVLHPFIASKRGTLNLRDCLAVGIPGGTGDYWIECGGSLYSDGVDYRGEGGGMQICRFTGRTPKATPWVGGESVVIRGGDQFHKQDSALALVGGVPTYISLYRGARIHQHPNDRGPAISDELEGGLTLGGPLGELIYKQPAGGNLYHFDVCGRVEAEIPSEMHPFVSSTTRLPA